MDDVLSRRIETLSPDVVSKIACGEVVQRPVNAVKELIENSIDAGATTITVTLAKGGLDLIQVADDGKGIRPDDMPLVCLRYATSKLRKYSDLQTISSFGFRGEALAALSHCARVTVLSRTATETLAREADYSDNAIVGDVRKRAQPRQGTTVSVRDLFYNMLTRRKAYRSESKEYALIYNTIVHYALRYPQVLFRVRRDAQTKFDLQTTPAANCAAAIEHVHGELVAQNTLTVHVPDADCRAYGARVHECLLVSPVCPVHKHARSFTMVVFINGRLVDWPALRRPLELVCGPYYHAPAHPYIYVDVSVPPDQIDVNVHPTKQLVRMLHDTELVEIIQKAVNARLIAFGESRTLQSQTLFNPNRKIQFNQSQKTLDVGASKKNDSDSKPTKPVYAHSLVRTDAKQLTLHDSLLMKPSTSSQPPTSSTRLTSVQTMRKEIEQGASRSVRVMLKKLVVIGATDARTLIVQYDTRLCAIPLLPLTYELVKQATVYRFGAVPKYALRPSVSIDRCIRAKCNRKLGVSNAHIDTVRNMAPMLLDYFSIDIGIDENDVLQLRALPRPINGVKLRAPAITRLVAELCLVNYTDELVCFREVVACIARLYARSIVLAPTTADGCAKSGTGGDELHTAALAVCAQVKRQLLPPSTWPMSVLKHLVKLHDLYKVFERC